ncbi:MAG: hypothetical protein J6U04_00220 [Salinivirgaceae bacterium]|nr:hypothetical protein [Salinivirgaceae bacterium]
MKTKILSIAVLTLSATMAVAQNEDDAIRYSNVVPMGTAKFISMGGAMGAIGGDMSAISINPAGLGVYRKDQFSFTPMWYSEKSDAEMWYTDNNKNKQTNPSAKTNTTDFKFSNVGLVTVFPADADLGLVSFSSGIYYNRIANFAGGYVAKGNNAVGSMLDKEVDEFNDDEAGGKIFFRSYLFRYDSIDKKYYNDYEWVGRYGSDQRKSVSTSGNMGEYCFALGFNINDKYYLGGSLNIVRVNYKQVQDYYEKPDFDDIDLIDFNVTDEFITAGGGVNMKLGVIGWLNDYLRFGASFQTPTILNLTDDYGKRVDANVVDWIPNEDGTEYYPSPLNGSAESSGTLDWNLTLPSRFTGSLAFVAPQRGMIDIDCEIVNYSAANIDDDDGLIYNDFADLNDRIADIYHTTLNLRLGGELTFGPVVARGGFGFYGSPYKSSEVNSSASRKVFSLGMGYRTQHFSFDLGYSLASCKQTTYLYKYDYCGADLKTRNSALAMTFGFRF